jgi:hypothetical protein
MTVARSPGLLPLRALPVPGAATATAHIHQADAIKGCNGGHLPSTGDGGTRDPNAPNAAIDFNCDRSASLGAAAVFVSSQTAESTVNLHSRSLAQPCRLRTSPRSTCVSR